MMRQWEPKPIRVICCNCHSETIGFQDETGMTRIQCKKCGTVTVSRVMSRRHVQLDVYAPKGQELLWQEREIKCRKEYSTVSAAAVRWYTESVGCFSRKRRVRSAMRSYLQNADYPARAGRSEECWQRKQRRLPKRLSRHGNGLRKARFENKRKKRITEFTESCGRTETGSI